MVVPSRPARPNACDWAVQAVQQAFKAVQPAQAGTVQAVQQERHWSGANVTRHVTLSCVPLAEGRERLVWATRHGVSEAFGHAVLLAVRHRSPGHEHTGIDPLAHCAGPTEVS